MSVVELFTDYYQWTVSAGGTDAPAAGTSQSFTVPSGTGVPAASSATPSEFWIVDAADSLIPPEYMKVTNVAGTAWTATRGAAGAAPWAHAPNWTAIPCLPAEALNNALATVEPPGVIKPYAGFSAPTGYLLCDGTAVSRATYARLFAAMCLTTTGTTNATNVITAIPSTALMGVGMPISGGNIPAGTTITSIDSASQIHISNNATGSTTGGAIVVAPFGVGDGSTTFNVPDSRGKTLIGAGTGTGLTARVLGVKGGEETHILSTGELAAHSHPVIDPTHGHTGVQGPTGSGGTNPGWIMDRQDNGTTQGLMVSPTGLKVQSESPGSMAVSAGSTGITTTDSIGTSTAHNNMQPFLAANCIIKT